MLPQKYLCCESESNASWDTKRRLCLPLMSNMHQYSTSYTVNVHSINNTCKAKVRRQYQYKGNVHFCKLYQLSCPILLRPFAHCCIVNAPDYTYSLTMHSIRHVHNVHKLFCQFLHITHNCVDNTPDYMLIVNSIRHAHNLITCSPFDTMQVPLSLECSYASVFCQN